MNENHKNMALFYEPYVINGITVEQTSDTTWRYLTPSMPIVVDLSVGNGTFTSFAQGTSQKKRTFDSVVTKYGTTDAKEYIEYLINNDFFASAATSENQDTANSYLESIDERMAETLRAPYGEIEIADSEPVVAGNAIYGFTPTNFQNFTSGDGSTSISNRKMVVSSGTSLGTFAATRSFRSINYKTGQGAIVRFSALFPSHTPTSWTGAGAFNIGDELSFGYSGDTFGIWHRYNGLSEVRTLTFTVGTVAAETATVTINGVIYSIPLSMASSASQCARQVAEYLMENASSSLLVDQIGTAVKVMFTSDGAKSDTYSFATSMMGTATASWAQNTAGVSKTSTHIAMSAWDIPNGFTGFDPSMGNSYAINIKNGFASIDFYIANTLGKYVLVHTIKWANANTGTNLINPSLRCGVYATAVGVTAAVTAELAYISGLVTGRRASIRNPRAFSNTKSISTTRTNILTIRCRNIYNNFANQIEIEPRMLTLANDGAKSAIFELRTNPTVVAGTKNFAEVGTNLASLADVSGTTVSADGTLIASFTVAKSTTASIDLTALDIRIPASLDLVICGYMTSGAAADLTASLNWYEDI